MTIPDTPFGEHVRERLAAETVVWLTTVAEDGTPQPNPVWFLWDGADSVVVYNDRKAKRLARLLAGPRVSLNLDTADGGEDVVVLTGRAEPAPDVPGPDANPEYLAKYGELITGIGYDVDGFAARWNVPVRIRIEKVRGM